MAEAQTREWHCAEAPPLSEQARICRVSGYPEALRMDPVVMAAAAKLWQDGAWPLRADPHRGAWTIRTDICSGCIVPTGRSAARVVLFIRKEAAPPETWPKLYDGAIRFNAHYNTARFMTAPEAAQAAELPPIYVEAAIRGATGVNLRPEMAYNGIALWALLQDFCLRRAEASPRGESRALWESRAEQIKSYHTERWLFNGKRNIRQSDGQDPGRDGEERQ